MLVALLISGVWRRQVLRICVLMAAGASTPGSKAAASKRPQHLHFGFSYTDTGSHGGLCWWVFALVGCISVFSFGDKFALWPHFSDRSEKSCFFSLFGFLLVRMECQLWSSLHVRLETGHLFIFWFIYFVACVNSFFYCCVIIQYMDMPHLLYSFTFWGTFGLFPNWVSLK